VGQWCWQSAIPTARRTVSLGIVSAKGRNLEIPDLLNDFIQTDALIDRGSSGGRSSISTGASSASNSRGQGRGIGFTIDRNRARRNEAARQRGIERGYLGISLQPLDRDLAEHLGLGEKRATRRLASGLV